MIGILTTIIGVVAKGKAAKAIAGGIAGAIATQAGPLIDVFGGGVVQGATPAVGDIGQIVGTILGTGLEMAVGGAVGYFLPWAAPKNKDA